MSGYSPFAWSFGLSVLKAMAEPKWLKYLETTDATPAGTAQAYKEKAWMARPPIVSYIGWALLRIVLCIDMALISELVGMFVLNATHYKGYDIKTHSDPYAITFIGCVGGAISTIFLFIIDVIYGTPEKRDRYALDDLTTAEKSKDSKNFTEGHPITLKKMRTHAGMRIVIWPIIAIIAGATGTVLWHVSKKVKKGQKGNTGSQLVTGIIVQLVGTAVTVIGPSLIQILSLTGEMSAPQTKKRQPKP